MYHYLDPNPNGSPLVLFLHGLGADSEMWVYQLAELAKSGMRPVAVDLPGFGKTPMENGQWEIETICRDLASWLKQLTSEKKMVVGLSMGGVIAQRFAIANPAEVNRLVLASTFATLRPTNMQSWFYLLKRSGTVLLKGSAAQAELVANHLFPEASQAVYRQMVIDKIRQADPRAYRKAMRSLVLFDNRRQLKNLTMPVLVITGARDGTVSPTAQTALAGFIPRSQHVVIPGAGHAVNVDQPILFNQILLNFLHSADG